MNAHTHLHMTYINEIYTYLHTYEKAKPDEKLCEAKLKLLLMLLLALRVAEAESLIGTINANNDDVE